MEINSQRILLGAAGAGGDAYFISKNTLPLSANLWLKSVITDGTKNIYANATYSSANYGLPVFAISSKGNLLWSKNIVFSNNNSFEYNIPGRNIAVDNNGDIVIVHTHEDGSFNDRGVIVRLDPSTGNFASTGLTYKEYRDNTTSWDLRFDSLISISSSEVYIFGTKETSSGWFSAILRLSSSTIIDKFLGTGNPAFKARANARSSDGSIWVLLDDRRLYKLNSNLAYVSQVGFYPTNFASGFTEYELIIDNADNMYYIGTGNGSSSTAAGCIIKFNSSGVIQWVRYLGQVGVNANNNIYFRSGAVDSSGNVYVCGEAYPGTGSNGGVIAKFNGSGTLQWQRSFAESGTSGYRTSLKSITVDGNDDLIIGGSQDGDRIAYILRLPNDGSLTGTYGNFTYASTSFAVTNGTTAALTNANISSSTTLPVTTATTATNNSISITDSLTLL
jgi:hypothetical protein